MFENMIKIHINHLKDNFTKQICKLQNLKLKRNGTLITIINMSTHCKQSNKINNNLKSKTSLWNPVLIQNLISWLQKAKKFKRIWTKLIAKAKKHCILWVYSVIFILIKALLCNPAPFKVHKYHLNLYKN